MTTDVQVITPELIQNAYTYEAYRKEIDRLLAQGKTTGDDHSEAMIHYAKMNVHRMKRHDKYAKVPDSLRQTLENIKQKQIWLVITEGWCGDAAQSVPVINKIAEASPMIDLKLILRDEHPDVIDQFLTNGKSRSIPIAVILDAETLDVLGKWGPRPVVAQDMVVTLKSSSDISGKEVSEMLHKWYADNKNEEIFREFSEILQTLS
jgi:hypothetical protein